MGLHRERRKLRELGAHEYARRIVKNRLIAMGNRISPARHFCPCCGWRGARFFDYFGKGYGIANFVCPRCESQPRHRGLIALLRREIPLLRANSRVLHFAPEPSLAEVFAARSDLIHITTDLRMRRVSIRADAMRMPFRSGVFALVVASHVLEHIRDDSAALAEISRVMEHGGKALILAPMLRSWRETPTLEFGAPNPANDDHWRIYGSDFARRIKAAGLRCESLDFDSIVPASDFACYGLRSEPVFMARKPVQA
ncbi:MAG: methyltransferase domain-containing protein [Candidatus Binataceae bacterium]